MKTGTGGIIVNEIVEEINQYLATRERETGDLYPLKLLERAVKEIERLWYGQLTEIEFQRVVRYRLKKQSRPNSLPQGEN